MIITVVSLVMGTQWLPPLQFTAAPPSNVEYSIRSPALEIFITKPYGRGTMLLAPAPLRWKALAVTGKSLALVSPAT